MRTAPEVHFVFRSAPGDQVQAERSEAYHEWAVGYLGVTPPKKIDFYKFADSPYSASRDTIRSRFEATVGLSVAEAETAWLRWLDQSS